MNEPDLAPRREVPIAAAFAGPAPDSGVREFSPELPPPSGRSARVLRNLTVAGLVTAVVLAVVYWPAGPDDPRPAMRTARPFDSVATQRSATNPTPSEPVFGLPLPDGLRPAGGLESDPAAQHRAAAKAGNETEASEVAIVFFEEAIYSFKEEERKGRNVTDPLARSYCGLGDAQFQANDLNKARICLENGLKLNPRIAKAHYALSRVLHRQGDSEGAAREMAEFERLNVDQGYNKPTGGATGAKQ